MGNFSASNYRRLVSERRAQQTFQVKLPSGAEFILRKPDMTAYLAGGELPQSYIKMMMEMQGKNKAATEKAISAMTPEERVADLMFLGILVKSACVEPKVVDEPQSDEEIKISDIDDEDLKFIGMWAMNAGGGADDKAAQKFRRKK